MVLLRTQIIGRGARMKAIGTQELGYHSEVAGSQ